MTSQGAAVVQMTICNRFIVSVAGLLPGSLKTAKAVHFTQSPIVSTKTTNSQTQDSLSASLNVVSHVPFVQGLSQKKDVSPVIVKHCKKKLKYVKDVSCVDQLSFVNHVTNIPAVSQIHL